MIETVKKVTDEEQVELGSNSIFTNPNALASSYYSNELLMTAALQYGLMAYDPFMLECLSPYTLRSRISTAQFKPIPHNDRIDLEAFRRKIPEEWNMDDVIGWMISVAKKHKIPVEDMNMHRFANCTGALLSLMNQKNFIERDNTFGCLLFNEFNQIMKENSSINAAARWLRGCESIHRQQQPSPSSSSSNMIDEINNYGGRLQQRRHSILKTSPKSHTPMKKIDRERMNRVDYAHSSTAGCRGKQIKEFVDNDEETNTTHKVVRKRAQRTTGNKLWEFIRGILIESESAPSVVRWENKADGVFRIVDSEKLARLWGEKKSNRNMTYEKLSRAMRTYYEKKILVPVPKTGMYPKKLVYKFGPNAVSNVSSSSNSKPNATTSGKVQKLGYKTFPQSSMSGNKYEMISDDESDV